MKYNLEMNFVKSIIHISFQAVARFLKEIVALGIRSRKGLIIDGEELTAKSMINLDGDSDLETVYLSFHSQI